MDTLFAEINKQLLEAEKKNQPEKIAKLLSPGLIFIRANGVQVDKETYLRQMAGSEYSLLEQHSMQIIPMSPDSVCILLEIEAQGTKPGGVSFGGKYRNARFFRKEQKDWKLYAWRNDEIKAPEPGTDSFTPPLGMKDKFSGLAVARKFYEQELPGGGKWQDVFFHPGARTHWHIHPQGQELSVLAGTAMVVIRKDNGEEEISRLKPGKQAHILPGLLHWHGATSDAFMMHIAFNRSSVIGETTYWFNPVSEEEYKKAQATA